MEEFIPQGLSGWDKFWDDMSKARKKDFDATSKELAEDVGKSYGATLRDLQAAMDANASAIRLVKKIKKSDRGPALAALAGSVKESLEQRDAKWADLGRSFSGKLKSILTSGLA